MIDVTHTAIGWVGDGWEQKETHGAADDANGRHPHEAMPAGAITILIAGFAVAMFAVTLGRTATFAWSPALSVATKAQRPRRRETAAKDVLVAAAAAGFIGGAAAVAAQFDEGYSVFALS